MPEKWIVSRCALRALGVLRFFVLCFVGIKLEKCEVSWTSGKRLVKSFALKLHYRWRGRKEFDRISYLNQFEVSYETVSTQTNCSRKPLLDTYRVCIWKRIADDRNLDLLCHEFHMKTIGVCVYCPISFLHSDMKFHMTTGITHHLLIYGTQRFSYENTLWCGCHMNNTNHTFHMKTFVLQVYGI